MPLFKRAVPGIIGIGRAGAQIEARYPVVLAGDAFDVMHTRADGLGL